MVIAMQGKKADRMVATLLVKLACFAVYGLSIMAKVTAYIPRIVILAVNANTNPALDRLLVVNVDSRLQSEQHRSIANASCINHDAT